MIRPRFVELTFALLLVSGCGLIAGVKDGKLVGPDAAVGGSSSGGGGTGGGLAGSDGGPTGGGGSTGGVGGSTGGAGGSTGGAGGSTGGGGGSSGAGTCPAPQFCLTVPQGFQGPVAYTEAASNPAACAGDFASEAAALNGGLTADPATCSCTCDPGTADCGVVTETAHATSCSNAACATATLQPGVCTPFDPSCGDHLQSTAVKSGSCTSKVKTVVPPVSWGKAYRVCDFTGTKVACGNGICVTPSSSPFASVACVTAVGDVPCPPAFPNKILGYTGATDSRACGAGTCACNSPSCGFVRHFSKIDCSSGSSGFGIPSCFGTTTSSFVAARYDKNVQCSPTGAVSPVGNVVPKDPRTICCL